MTELIKKNSDLWIELRPLIPDNNYYSNDLHFINSVLNLLKEKETITKNNRFISSLDWKNMKPANWRSTYNRRFNRWRNNGVWEQMLPVLIKYSGFAWLGNPYVYTLLLKDYKSYTFFNRIYLYSLNGEFDDMLNDEELQYVLHKLYPKYMKNRDRRKKIGYDKRRGAYMKKYSKEEQVRFSDDII